MTIKEWKAEMKELVDDFQFTKSAGDIERLRELLAEAEKISAWAERLLDD